MIPKVLHIHRTPILLDTVTILQVEENSDRSGNNKHNGSANPKISHTSLYRIPTRKAVRPKPCA